VSDAPDDSSRFSRELISLIPQLRAFARILAGNVTEAEDLAQEALARAWMSRASYTPGTKLKAWLFVILRHQFYSQKRRSWRQVALSPGTAERILIAPDNPEDPIALNELRLALNTLSPEHREVLILIGAGGLSYEEAAEICGCRVWTIKSRLSRAREALYNAVETGTLARDGASAGDAMVTIHAHAQQLRARRKTSLGALYRSPDRAHRDGVRLTHP